MTGVVWVWTVVFGALTILSAESSGPSLHEPNLYLAASSYTATTPGGVCVGMTV